MRLAIKLEKHLYGGWHTVDQDGVHIYVHPDYPEAERGMVNDYGLSYREAHRLANQEERRLFGNRAFRREAACTGRILGKGSKKCRGP